MDVESTPQNRHSLKRPLDAHSGNTPAPKRVQLVPKPTPDPESEDDNPESPTATVTQRRKHTPTQTNPKSSAPRLPPPQFITDAPVSGSMSGLTLSQQEITLPPAFEPPPQELTPAVEDSAQSPEPNEQANALSAEEIQDALSGFREDWGTDPTLECFDMAAIVDAVPELQMPTTAPTQTPFKQEWALIQKTDDRPELHHYSDNPFDFLPNTKLDKLIQFWKKDQEATDELTKSEREILGEPRIKKMLAKVVTIGKTPIEDKRKNKWIRTAMLSALAQSGLKVESTNALRLAINPAKPGYSWMIIPVKLAPFKALKEICGALDPRSGTLVLLRPWEEVSFPTQCFYATGIHHPNDKVPLEVAVTDYSEQMEASLSKYNIKILGMTPARYGEDRKYSIEIKFGFGEGTKPFLINPMHLAKQFWTGLGNQKTNRMIEYKWPAKCRLCESEAHLMSSCPWGGIEVDSCRPDFYNCRRHYPGWIEPPRRSKGTTALPQPEIVDLGPKQTRVGGLKTKKGKGKERAMDVD